MHRSWQVEQKDGEPAGRISRPEVAIARRVVIKLGTRVLVNSDGSLAGVHLRRMVGSVAELVVSGRQVIIVSSGAVGLGRAMLQDARGLGANARRVYAAVGQGQLLGHYHAELARHGLTCAQVLVTEQDFDTRKRYLDLKQTLGNLLHVGAVPVLNDNDVVRHGAACQQGEGEGRAVFDDNDRLAALVAAKCEADLLLILTDVGGVYDRDPKVDSVARVLPRLEAPERLIDKLPEHAGSPISRGGMRSKLESALVARAGGVQVVIADGRAQGTVEQVLAGQEIGTWIPAEHAQPARRRWIAHAAVPKGSLRLDAGAVSALREHGASLLPVGVVEVCGHFQKGDVVELVGPDGLDVGRAWIDLDVNEVKSWCAGEAPKPNLNCLVRRDDIVLRSNR